MKPKIQNVSIPGIGIGHAQNIEEATGCTVILCPAGAVGGVSVRGGAPATRETDLLHSERLVEKVNAIVLSGGSAFGLDAAGGVMKCLEEAGYGFDTGICKVPIVCGASLFDLGLGSASSRPDSAMGYEAAKTALSNLNLSEQENAPQLILEGNVGAGTGASVGKLADPSQAMKGGIGYASKTIAGIEVAAIVAVNALGTIVSQDGSPLAGVVAPNKDRILNADESMQIFSPEALPFTNTTIACVITNAKLTKVQANHVSQLAHDGYARAIKPVHTSNDGDAVFALATGEKEAPDNLIGILAADCCECAIRRAVLAAQPAYGLLAASSFIVG